MLSFLVIPSAIMPPPIPLHPMTGSASPGGPPNRKPTREDLEAALGEGPAQRDLRLQELFAVFDENAGRTGSVDKAALEAGFDALVCMIASILSESQRGLFFHHSLCRLSGMLLRSHHL